MLCRERSEIWCVALLVVLSVLLAGCFGGHSAPETKPIEKNAEFSMRMAKSLFDGGRVSEALAELDEAIARYPDDARLHHSYGGFCLRAARYEQALDAYKRALEIDPFLTDAHNALGAVYTELKDYIAAEREFETVLEDPAYPTPHKTYFNLGRLYDEQGRDDEAISSVRRAVGIDPKYYSGHFLLASLLDKVGKLIEAAREYEVAEPAYRNNGEYWYRRGFAYYRLGQVDKARDSLVRVRSISPGSESAARAEELLGLLD